MKKVFLSFFIFLIVFTGLSMAQQLPDRKDILKSTILVNDYFMKKHADYAQPSYVNRFRPSNIWTRGVYYEGLMALYSIYPR